MWVEQALDCFEIPIEAVAEVGEFDVFQGGGPGEEDGHVFWCGADGFQAEGSEAARAFHQAWVYIVE